MEIGSEKNARRILAIGVLFATIGILALVITLMQPSVQDQHERLAAEIFANDISIEEKEAVLKELGAPGTSTQISEEEKLRVLESLRAQ